MFITMCCVAGLTFLATTAIVGGILSMKYVAMEQNLMIKISKLEDENEELMQLLEAKQGGEPCSI